MIDENQRIKYPNYMDFTISQSNLCNYYQLLYCNKKTISLSLNPGPEQHILFTILHSGAA
jgi:hypothetical protein